MASVPNITETIDNTSKNKTDNRMLSLIIYIYIWFMFLNMIFLVCTVPQDVAVKLKECCIFII